MSMRGSTARHRGPSAVDPRAFEWDKAVVATLRHSTLPWDESFVAAPLNALRDLGNRDRLSLLAQFAAHQAMLQFAAITDGDLDRDEWAVVHKRGTDVRLIRIRASACDASSAPSVLTLAQQFADAVGAELEILRQPWARADAIYAEAFARLTKDIAADLRHTRNAACGAILSPGPEGLRTLVAEPGRYAASDEEAIQAVQRFAELESPFRVIVLRGVSPLDRYSALGTLAGDRAGEPSVVAERILAATSSVPHLFIVAGWSMYDEGSRHVVELLARARHGRWLTPDGEVALPESRPFIVAPRLAARTALDVAYEDFVHSADFAAYLSHGDLPARAAALPVLLEPLRSYIAALALIGTRIRLDAAARFLSEFLFTGSLQELAVDGFTHLEGEEFVFVSDAARREAARMTPPASRAAIARVAASHASGVEAVMLLLEAGDPSLASAALDATVWRSSEELVSALRRLPQDVLSPSLAQRYAHALVDCGRYRDTLELPGVDELALARAERRMGDYGTALARLERMEGGLASRLLRAEVLRLLDRDHEALEILDECSATTDEEQTQLDYERALHGAAVSLPPEHYLAARLATYRAVERGEYDEASRRAEESYRRARTVTERIDASLDRLFTTFSAGQWDRARAVAVEALREVEETQGDRATGGILFTLAYLAADDGQWAHAAQRIASLRRYYASTKDEVRGSELKLLAAHLDFSRGRFADARVAAQSVYDTRRYRDQIREAASLILDELDRMEGHGKTLRSTGLSGNAELRRRHLRLRAGMSEPIGGDGVAAKLSRFRIAVATKDEETARALASELDLVFDPAPAADEIELRMLRLAATRDYPYAPQDFDVAWCHATRNRLGHWTAIGSHPLQGDAFDEASRNADWITCSERELLYIESSARWTTEGRDAIAAIFRTRAENHRLHRLIDQEESAPPPKIEPIEGIVGQSHAIREVESLVARVARRDVAVCILGESGTGKELVAHAIHRQSGRRRNQFTAVNCAALPENLVESELFGHVRGAFTGADRDRAGLIETTDGGTLFLDEIGELPLTAQAKLLRFLQEGEFRRVGDTASRSADVRIVSATNRRLDSAVEEGTFRDDLYYRVRGVEVVLPPLRERGSDILLLAAHFLAGEREKHRSGPSALSPDVEAIFTAYAWPGNVRELQNTIRAAHAMAGESREIDVEHLPERMRRVAPARQPPGSYQHAVARFKRDLIERSLSQAEGNQNRAAAMLRISRQALAYQIRELGIMVRG